LKQNQTQLPTGAMKKNLSTRHSFCSKTHQGWTSLPPPRRDGTLTLSRPRTIPQRPSFSYFWMWRMNLRRGNTTQLRLETRTKSLTVRYAFCSKIRRLISSLEKMEETQPTLASEPFPGARYTPWRLESEVPPKEAAQDASTPSVDLVTCRTPNGGMGEIVK